MSLDITTLQILRSRESYEKYSRLVPEGLLDTVTSLILIDYGRYYKDHATHKFVDVAAFKSAFFGAYHPKLTDEQRIHYNAVLVTCLSKPIDPIVAKNWINNIVEQDYAAQIMEVLQKYNEGGDVDIIRSLESLVGKASEELDKKKETTFITDDINDLLAVDEHQTGITWRLQCLHTHMRPMIAGDFGLVAGRPDSGKTTFIVSELPHMAHQIPEAFGEDRPILWVNNEGPGRRIKPRLYQGALDLTLPEMIAMNKQGALVPAYVKAVGAVDRIKILDVHGWYNYEVEDVIKDERPAIIVYDMIDNLKFAGGSVGARTDQMLEGMYQWARETSVKYDSIGIATSQISAEGDGLLFPTMSMLKDSKTGKQGACDFQIMIGRSNSHDSESCRGISIVKNKLRVTGMKGDPRAEVIFNGNNARYRDAV